MELVNCCILLSETMPGQAISSVVGLGGFVSYLPGAAIAELIGYVLKTSGSYVTIFAGASMMYVLSLLVLHLLVPRIQPSA